MWDYIVTKYYGFLVNARKTGKNTIDKIMNKFHICKYIDESTHLRSGFIIFYVYEEEVDSDEGSYWCGHFPDTTGTAFESPKHPTYFKNWEALPPHNLSPKVYEALKTIEKECVIENGLRWYEIAEVFY